MSARRQDVAWGKHVIEDVLSSTSDEGRIPEADLRNVDRAHDIFNDAFGPAPDALLPEQPSV
ncbi:hypothetical protein ITJ66_07240 [Plantibacter sp. VKM Ac-2885]|uniref:hypothetical protein n=1 Tax=Plantibacter sp. VKM Ac-2885 TaxID=2783828 RepID=UPI00188A7A12|nr:hypothetical protein [Plantibacter sp. VKM Ac-2885]MBF4512282.1 hypothetical protein [Plantibacter sp. VKM Ac-2885]